MQDHVIEPSEARGSLTHTYTHKCSRSDGEGSG